MALTYTWNFNPLEVTYSSASLANVVSTVHWQCHSSTEGTSSLGVSGSFSAQSIGTVGLEPVASADFVAYESLTEDVVLGWVTASMGDASAANVTSSISKSISEQLSPSTGTKQQPW